VAAKKATSALPGSPGPLDAFAFQSQTESETIRLGALFGKALRGGEVLALFGPIGAGKTTFVRGLAQGLGITQGVRSPSFTLVSRLSGRVTLFHLDLYRLDPPVDLLPLGWDVISDGTAVVVIEWAEKAAEALPSARLDIYLRYEGTGRAITVRAWTPDLLEVVEAVRRRLDSGA